MNSKITEEEIEILSNHPIFEDLKPEFKSRIHDFEFVSSCIEEALRSNDRNLTEAACAVYFHFKDKKS